MFGLKTHPFEGKLVRITVTLSKGQGAGSVTGILLRQTPYTYQLSDEHDLSRDMKLEVRKEHVILIELEDALRNYELKKMDDFDGRVAEEPKYSV